MASSNGSSNSGCAGQLPFQPADTCACERVLPRFCAEVDGVAQWVIPVVRLGGSVTVTTYLDEFGNEITGNVGAASTACLEADAATVIAVGELLLYDP